jgi:asparagine N-glycosylation enzyme membrane subunit Stt3
MLLAQRDIAFNLVLIWAFYGIFYKRNHADVVYDAIVISTLVAIGVLLLLSIYTFVSQRKIMA